MPLLIGDTLEQYIITDSIEQEPTSLHVIYLPRISVLWHDKIPRYYIVKYYLGSLMSRGIRPGVAECNYLAAGVLCAVKTEGAEVVDLGAKDRLSLSSRYRRS